MRQWGNAPRGMVRWHACVLACDVRESAIRPPVRDRNAWLLTPELLAAVWAAHAGALRGIAFAWGHLSRRCCVKVAVLQEDVQAVPLHTGPPHQFRQLAGLHARRKVREVRLHSFANRSDGAWRHLIRVTLRWPRGAEVGIAHSGAVARVQACRRRERHWRVGGARSGKGASFEGRFQRRRRALVEWWFRCERGRRARGVAGGAAGECVPVSRAAQGLYDEAAASPRTSCARCRSSSSSSECAQRAACGRWAVGS